MATNLKLVMAFNNFRGTEIEEPDEDATELDRQMYKKRKFTIVSIVFRSMKSCEMRWFRAAI